MKINALKGMKDILPAEQRMRDYVQGKILQTYREAGFERISTPMLEDAENLDKSDGGDVFVYGLRNCLGWNEKRFRSSLYSLESGKFPEVDNVIVADDFTGTGERLSGMLKQIKNKHPDITIRFVSICLMESVAREKYPDLLSYQYYAPILLEPGMDHSKDPRVKTMEQIEEYLSPKYSDMSLDTYRLGYKGSGALYWNRQYRVPNNVYPIFWWKKRRDGTDIDPIMDYY